MDNNKILDDILNNDKMKIIEILDECPQYALITLLGEIEKDNNKEKFILKLKKKEFESELLLKDNITLQKVCSEPSMYFSNDIYKKFLSKDLIQNKVNIELIYPVNDKIIDKHRKANFELFTETYEIYLNKTLKYINSIDKNDILWIKNIFEGKNETIFYKNDLFILVKNYTDKKGIDYLGFPFDSNIKCLRDLNEKHLKLLESFYFEGKKVFKEKLGVNENKIRAFIHYPPSFYYFHVHYLGIEKEDFSACINRAIDLGEVIQNIKLKNDYYQTITIDHTIKIGSKLYEILTNK